MTESTHPLANLNIRKIEKIQSSYTAIQILTLFSVTLSIFGIGMLGYSLVTSAGWEGFTILVILWNLPLALLLWKRSALGFYAGLIYCVPLIPTVLGLILFVMWFRTKIYFGKNRVSIDDVKSALYSGSASSSVSGVVHA